MSDMGTVLAKDVSQPISYGTNYMKQPRVPPGVDSGGDEEAQKNKIRTVDLKQIAARVDKVNVDGLVKTHDDIVQESVKELFQAKNFEEMIKKAHIVRGKLQGLGCFRNIGIHIDTSDGPGSTPNGYEVTYQVVELRAISGGITTHVSNNEGVLVVNLALPNMFGRGEGLKGEFSYGSRKSKIFNSTFSKPFPKLWNSLGSVSLFQNEGEFPVSGYKITDRGGLLDFTFSTTPKVKHSVQLEGLWRVTGLGNKYAAFELREACGSGVKGSFRHIVTKDRRDTPIFPSSGHLLRFLTEIAGGNSNYFKNEFNYQGNWSLLNKDLLIQMTFNIGAMFPNEVPVCDRFFLGGPTTLRGFKYRGIGPKIGESYVGGPVYWSSGLHLYTPLPFRPGSGGFGDLFRLHFFVNGGNVGEFDISNPSAFFQEQAETLRMAAGIGIALKLGQVARLEFNCPFVPIKFQEGDDLAKWFQFGIGVEFV